MARNVMRDKGHLTYNQKLFYIFASFVGGGLLSRCDATQLNRRSIGTKPCQSSRWCNWGRIELALKTNTAYSASWERQRRLQANIAALQDKTMSLHLTADFHNHPMTACRAFCARGVAIAMWKADAEASHLTQKQQRLSKETRRRLLCGTSVSSVRPGNARRGHARQGYS